jgi:hypothetical protein
MNLNVNVSRGDSTTYGEAYHWADNYLTPGNRFQHTPDPESGAFYARIGTTVNRSDRHPLAPDVRHLFAAAHF